MNRYKNDKADETRMIRFIDPNYRELFQIPDGAYVEVKYPNSTVIVACRYMDEYHLRFGSEVYHICELAERLERCQERVLRSRRLRKMSVPGSWVIRAIYMYRYQKMAMITSYTIPIFQSGMAARWIRMAP